MRAPRLLALALAILGASLLAACGGSASSPTPNPNPGAKTSGAPSTLAELAAYQGPDRQQMLEAGAKKEGALTWYTSLAGDVIDGLTNGFKQKYGIPVDVFRAPED